MAKILKRFRKEKRGLSQTFTDAFGLPYASSSTTMTTAKSMQLSAVYRCVEVITDAVAMMPVDILRLTENKGWTVDAKHPQKFLLDVEPNKLMTRFTFWKTLVAKVLLEGNGYAKIHRDGSGNPLRYELITDPVTVYQLTDGSGLVYKIKLSDSNEDIVSGEDMLHILNFSYDGLIGVSTLTHAALSTGLANSAELQAQGFFTGGANLSGILKVTGKITPEKAATMKTAWSSAFEVEDGTPAGVAVIEAGTEFQPVMVNPRDAQMLESRQYSVVEICRFFGVSPTKAFDTNASSYNSVEAGQLAFMTDAVQPITSKIENEVNRKVWRPSEKLMTKARFDTDELLRIDSDSQANYMMKMFQIGAYTSNEIRSRIGNTKVDGGDTPYVQVNMQPLGTPVKATTETKSKKKDTNLEVK